MAAVNLALKPIATLSAKSHNAVEHITIQLLALNLIECLYSTSSGLPMRPLGEARRAGQGRERSTTRGGHGRNYLSTVRYVLPAGSTHHPFLRPD